MIRDAPSLREIMPGAAASDRQFADVAAWVSNIRAKTGFPDMTTSAIIRVDSRRFMFATPMVLDDETILYVQDEWGRAMPGYSLFILHSTVYIPMEVAHGDQGSSDDPSAGREGAGDRGDEAGRLGEPADGEGGRDELGGGGGAELSPEGDPDGQGAADVSGVDAPGDRPATRAEDQRRRRRKASSEDSDAGSGE